MSTPAKKPDLISKTLQDISVVLEMIKFEHTVFALPFALTGMLVAANGFPGWYVLIWIVIASVFARSAAMSFNRWADAELDARNPRTAVRAIPARQLTKEFVLTFTGICVICFIVSAWMLNDLAFFLSPVAMLILLGYSYCKRFTSLAHVVLGLALAVAPVGAWIAVRGEFDLPPIVLAMGVLTWTTGFDLIYACQDIEVDQKEKLFSIPSRFGKTFSINLSRILHGVAVLCFGGFGILAGLHFTYYIGVAVAAGLLFAMQLVVNPDDVKKINLAFFTINSWVGIAIFAGTLIATMLSHQ